MAKGRGSGRVQWTKIPSDQTLSFAFLSSWIKWIYMASDTNQANLYVDHSLQKVGEGVCIKWAETVVKPVFKSCHEC